MSLEDERQAWIPKSDDVRVVGVINYETGEMNISYLPLDAITRLARLVDPDAGNEIDSGSVYEEGPGA